MRIWIFNDVSCRNGTLSLVYHTFWTFIFIVYFILKVGPEGKVIGIEHIKELVDMSRKNIKKDRPELLESQRIVLIHGDGRKGYPEEAPYDCMYIYSLNNRSFSFFFYLL
jgi:hypothetical protein